VLALNALVTATGQPLGGDRPRRIQIALDGNLVREIVIPTDQSQVLKQVDLSDRLRPGKQTLQLADVGGAAAGFQVIFSYHAADPSYRPKDNGLAIDVTYDRQQIPVNGMLTATATVTNRTGQKAPMLIARLPIPAGFDLNVDEFSKLVGTGGIAKFQLAPGSVTVYLRAIDVGGVWTLPYHLRATMPAKLTVPPAEVYEYYDPDKSATSSSARVAVLSGEPK
jgi:hypothetical protein